MNHGTSKPQNLCSIGKEVTTFYRPIRKALKDILSAKKQDGKEHAEWTTICVHSSVSRLTDLHLRVHKKLFNGGCFPEGELAGGWEGYLFVTLYPFVTFEFCAIYIYYKTTTAQVPPKEIRKINDLIGGLKLSVIQKISKNLKNQV